MKILTLPEPPGSYQRDYFLRLVNVIRNALANTIDTQQSVGEFYLRSPSGKVYRVTVSDAGALTTTYVQG